MATDDFWSILDGPEPVELEVEPISGKQHREQVHCLCGRFAKWVGGRHYYNGQFDCYRYTVRCSRCGDVDVECV